LFISGGIKTLWRLGRCFLLTVGLYFVALSLLLRQTILLPFLQIAHRLIIGDILQPSS